MKKQNQYILSSVLLMTMLFTILLLSTHTFAVRGQDPKPFKVEITPYEGNPILTRGADGDWDSDFVFAPSVIYKDGLYHMFYSGGENFQSKPHAIGYATSKDGLHWTKYANNPILQMDAAISKGDIPIAAVVVNGDNWALYFDDIDHLSGGSFYGSGILRATASAPSGPWTIDEKPVLQVGTSKEWDSRDMIIGSVVHDTDQYVLYYYAQNGIRQSFGMATSTDGSTWTKYNDPATTDPEFASSDPVFTGEANKWDAYNLAGPSVLHMDRGWEMFYMGGSKLGYATSPDGITWTRFADNPVSTNFRDYNYALEGVVMIDNKYYIYHDMFSSKGINLGVATGIVTYQ